MIPAVLQTKYLSSWSEQTSPQGQGTFQCSCTMAGTNGTVQILATSKVSLDDAWKQVVNLFQNGVT